MGPWGILAVVAAVLIADRATKALAAGRLAGRSGDRGLLRLSVNERLPLAAGVSRPALAALWVGALGCVTLAMTVSPALRGDPAAGAGVAAAMAGAASNLGDLIRHGAVVDFIAVGWWPVFNLADVAIVAGGALAALSLL